ncbi:MAG: hypothetical protein KDK63_01750 [Chlamydiia bacterium]|nr:hypothetical protein [Chlamydiia bacterium]
MYFHIDPECFKRVCNDSRFLTLNKGKEMQHTSPFTLYLGRDGNSVTIKQFANQSEEKTALQLEAEACKTHQEVLAFLQKLNSSEEKSNLEFYHEHNIDYGKHRGTYPKGVAHPCAIQEQISFVMHKISEQEQGAQPQSMQWTGCILQ